jgi:hypothetical protein
MHAYFVMTVLLAAAPAPPASEQCDAKPFTLNKPVKPGAKPGSEAPKKTTAPKAAEAKPKPKPLADCDEPRKKG